MEMWVRASEHESHAQLMCLPAALLDFSACPAFIIRKLTRHSVLPEIDLPDNLPLFFGRQIAGNYPRTVAGFASLGQSAGSRGKRT